MRIEKLGNLVDLRQGLAINKANSHLVSTENKFPFKYPLLRIADMLSSTFEKFISSEVSSNVIVNPDDIIYTRTGQIGLVFRGQSGVVHNNSFIVTPVNVQVDRDYLFVILQSELVRKQAIKQAKNSVQPDITHEMFKNISIPLPTLSHQQKIANVILKIDQKIALNNQINEELEAMAKTLYDYWFVQFDFPDENGKPYKSSGGKMVYNDQLKREIPEGWGVKQLGELCTVIKKSINPFNEPNKYFNHYSIPSYDKTGTFCQELGSIIRSNKLVITETDLLISKLNPWFNRVVYVTQSGIASTEFIALETKKSIIKNSLYQVVTSQKFIDFCTQNATGTSNSHKRINPEVMLSFLIVYNKYYFEKFGKVIHEMRMQIIKNKQQNQELSQLRDWLLPMLMNGQVRVEDNLWKL